MLLIALRVNHIDQVEKIKSWSDYAVFFEGLYEAVAESPFEQNTIRNMNAGGSVKKTNYRKSRKALTL